MISGFQAFNIYLSLKLHFNSPTYDAIKYNFKTPSKRSSYDARRDRFFYERIARKYQTADRIIDYFTANILNDIKWVGDSKEETLIEFEKRLQSITYVFKTDVGIIKDEGLSFDAACSPSNNGTKNPLLDLLSASRITFETVAIIDLLVNFTKGLERHLNDPLGVYSTYIARVSKYKLLLRRKNIPLEKMKKIIIDSFSDSLS